MRGGRGPVPAPKRPAVATAQAPLLRRLPASAAAPHPRHPPSSSSAVPRRPNAHSAPVATKAGAVAGSGRPTANHHRDKAASASCGHPAQREAAGDAWEPIDAKSAVHVSVRPVRSVQKCSGVNSDARGRSAVSAPGNPTVNHVAAPSPRVATPSSSKGTAGIPRLTPAKRPPDPLRASSPPSPAAARVRDWTTAVSQHHAAAQSSRGRDEEERRKRARRLPIKPKTSSSQPTKDRTSTPPNRRRELPDGSCSEVVADERHAEEERLEPELHPEIDDRGPSKSGIRGGEAGRSRNGAGAAARTAEAPASADREEGSSLSNSAEQLEQNHRPVPPEAPTAHHAPPPQAEPQQQQPPRQLGRRKLAAQAAAAAAAAAAAEAASSGGSVPPEARGGGAVMVGREENEEGGRTASRPRMDTGNSRKRPEEEEEGDEGVVVRELDDGGRRGTVVVVTPKEVESSSRGPSDDAAGVRKVVGGDGGSVVGVSVGDDGSGRDLARVRAASPPPRASASLERQLAALGREKSELESKLAAVLEGAEASREEVDQLRQEVADLKVSSHGHVPAQPNPDHREPVFFLRDFTLEGQRGADLDALEEENRALRERLRELSASQEGEQQQPKESALCDAEKEQLLLGRSNSGQALSTNSGEAMGCCGCDGSGGGPCATPVENTLCPTQEWDKQSSSSLSEVSVACLQDRILQMEETHYSTNEELQATLQELADLQAQLTDLQSENERLSEEKSVLLESLCRQTEKLEDTRSRADTLEELLLGSSQSNSLSHEGLDESGEPVGDLTLANGGGDGGDPVERSDREQKMVELLKNAQEERENLLSRVEDLKVQLEQAQEDWSSRGEESARLQDRVRLLESALEAANAERRELDKELVATKEESSKRQIQISCLSTLLDNARAKIEELEQAREVRDKCELDNLLDHARKEKDALESQVASLQEKLSHSQCEVTRLKDSVCSLQEECKVARNNAKSALSDLEYQLEQGRSEMALLAEEVHRKTEEVAGACAQSQQHLEDKRTLKAALSEAQRATLEVERQLNELKSELEEEKRLRKEENEEWEKFQSDLLVTVRVANDFRNEAKLELEKIVLENSGLKDKIKVLEDETEMLKAAPRPLSPSSTGNLTSSSSTISECRGLALRTVSAPPASAAAGSEGANVGAILNSVMQQQEAFAVRRQKPGGISRADSRLSVKSLIESIENATKQVKAGPGGGSRSSSSSSLNSITCSDPRGGMPLKNPSNNPQSPTITTDATDCDVFSVGNGSIKAPLRDQQQNNQVVSSTQRKPLTLSDTMYSNPRFYESLKESAGGVSKNLDEPIPRKVSILAKRLDIVRRTSFGDLNPERKDPLSALVRNGGSRRNALLKWCQNKTVGYRNIDITNFSSSWNDGLAFCALLHTYLPERIPYDTLTPTEKRKNFSLAFSAAESVGIVTSLNINKMIQQERPDWEQVMAYVTSIYKHFET
ncbi:cytospin-A-like [Ischnura elegans]|uniref:cytospin-A-like n=1 Tax=Ischnura elegans TaxID=197161 RepID=UPI001ED889AC|nr:cytospin-A-like [Ischnura elegans]